LKFELTALQEFHSLPSTFSVYAPSQTLHSTKEKRKTSGQDIAS
jgi:hypothetical protein